MADPVYLSIVEIPGDGVTTQHEFNFAGGYISRAHVKATIFDAAGAVTEVTVTSGMFVTDYVINLGVAAPIGGKTRIYRDTPRSLPLVDFEGGARFTEANLDLVTKQAIFAVAEAFDAGAYATVNDLLGAASASLAAAEAAAAESELAATTASAASAAAGASQSVASAAAIAAANSALDAIAALASRIARTGDSMTGDLSVPSINGGQLAGFRNVLLNGSMDVAQNGSTFAIGAGVGTVYTLDQWPIGNVSEAVLTATQNADVPSNSEHRFSLRVTVNTADAAVAAGNVCTLYQPCAGHAVRRLVGRDLVLSFDVKSPKTGVHCVVLKNGDNTLSYIAEYTVLAANTWETKTILIPGGLPSSGTWDFGTGLGLTVSWTLMAGSSYHSPAGSWVAGNKYSTANQVNVLDTAGAVFAITGVQLEAGTQRTPFEHRGYQNEERMCQEFYERGIATYIGPCTAGWAFGVPISFKTRKRTTPVVAFVPGTVSSTAGLAGALASNATPDSMNFQITANATGACSVSLHYEANARY